MNMDIASPTNGLPAMADSIGVEIDQLGARLRIINRIERGFGVVPILEDGAVLLRKGEVAVYREEPPFEMKPGLYCLEHQRLRLPASVNPEGWREVEREVVYVRPWSRGGTTEECWEYIPLRSKIVRGVRRYARPEGPISRVWFGRILLGPIIGVYAPNTFAGEC